MSKGRIVLLAALALAAVFVIAVAASGGEDEEKEGGEPETPGVPEEDAVSIRLDRYTAFVGVSDVLTLTATVTSDSPVTVAWSSSDESIATVDEGKAQFKKWGPCVITAEAGGCRAECLVVVDGPAHRSALDPTDKAAAGIEGKRILRAYASCEKQIAEGLMSYGYAEATAKEAASGCTGEWQFYADEAAKRINARGGYDKDAIVAEMVGEGWSKALAEEAATMTRA